MKAKTNEITREVITAKIAKSDKPSDFVMGRRPSYDFTTEDGVIYKDSDHPLRKGSTFYLLVDPITMKCHGSYNIRHDGADEVKDAWLERIAKQNDNNDTDDNPEGAPEAPSTEIVEHPVGNETDESKSTDGIPSTTDSEKETIASLQITRKDGEVIGSLEENTNRLLAIKRANPKLSWTKAIAEAGLLRQDGYKIRRSNYFKSQLTANEQNWILKPAKR